MHARLQAGAPYNAFRGGLRLAEHAIFARPGNACMIYAHVRNFHSSPSYHEAIVRMLPARVPGEKQKLQEKNKNFTRTVSIPWRESSSAVKQFFSLQTIATEWSKTTLGEQLTVK